MNLLYSSLKSIYNEYPKYRKFYPLEPLNYSLRQYLIQNIKDANFIIRPADYADKSTLNYQETLDIFLLLSKYGVFIKNYEIICDECDEPIVTNNINDIFYCSNGHKLIKTNNNIKDIFNNLSYLFEISPKLIAEIKDINTPLPFRNASKDNDADLEPISSSISVKPQDSDFEGIKGEFNHLHKILDIGILDIS